MASIAARACREIQDMIAFSVWLGPMKKQMILADVNARLRDFALSPALLVAGNHLISSR
jgi:hypothetical protein